MGVFFHFWMAKTARPFKIVQILAKSYCRSINEWCVIALARAHTRQYLFRRAIVIRAKVH